MSNLIYEIYAPVSALNPSTLICDVCFTTILHYLHLRDDYIIFIHLYESAPYLSGGWHHFASVAMSLEF
jgi:hypothetical protein